MVMKDRRNSMYKYAVVMYKKDGMFNYAEYGDNLYEIIKKYIQEEKTTNNPRPTLWIYDGNKYVRIHDFNFSELTPETYKLYLKERILNTDKLLEGVEENMNDVLEILKEAVRILEAEKESEKTVSVADLKAGEIFSKGGKEFVVLNQEDGRTRICLNGYHGEDMWFDADGCPDYKKSDMKEYCDTEVYEEFVEIFGEDNIFEEEVDLITIDGQKTYGSCNCSVRPLTFDEWRKYNQYLPKEVFDEWYWSCTPWSTSDRGWEHSVAVCTNSGYLSSGIASIRYRCAPACVISSSVKVERV